MSATTFALRVSTLLCLGVAPAAAHAILVDSTPAPYVHVAAGHLALRLRYNSRIDAARSKLTLRHGDSTSRLVPQPGAAPDTLEASVDLSQGAYEIAWQVLAVDGHVTRGRVPFIVDAGAATAAAGAGAPK